MSLADFIYSFMLSNRNHKNHRFGLPKDESFRKAALQLVAAGLIKVVNDAVECWEVILVEA